MTHAPRETGRPVPRAPMVAPAVSCARLPAPAFDHEGWQYVRYCLRLYAALRLRYPALEHCLGAEGFETLVRAFVHAVPPRSPVLIDWGSELARFLEEFAPTRVVAYLPDLARLEWLRWRALNAAGARPMPVHELAAWAAASAQPMFLRLHPSAATLTSVHPVVSVWRRSRALRSVPIGAWAPQSALVARSGATVTTVEIGAAAAAFVAALAEGVALDEARLVARATEPDFEATRVLDGLIRLGLVAGAC